MKKTFSITLLSGLAIAIASLSTPASANQDLALSLCSYAADNNKNQIRKTLSENRLRLRTIYDGVVCNGNNLVRHVIQFDAADAAGFIVSQMPASQFEASGDLAWAESQGLSDNAAATALKARIKG